MKNTIKGTAYTVHIHVQLLHVHVLWLHISYVVHVHIIGMAKTADQASHDSVGGRLLKIHF